MQKAAERVEAMFQQADSDINSLSQRLKFEFENNEDIQDSLQSNPAELLSKISDVKKEYSSLVQQVSAIQDSQKEALTEFRGHLNDVCQVLLTLQTNTGMMPTEKPAELTRLEEFLGNELPWGQDGLTGTSGGSGDASKPTLTPSGDKESPEENDPDPDCQACSPDASPSQPRRTSTDYVEVSKQEFESVSSLIRGRVKLSEVNTTYSSLWNHFKTNKKCKKIAPDELHKMGLRVSGVTGQAKLKVLRALKLIKLSPKGEVLPADK